jgi:hypothetical protein
MWKEYYFANFPTQTNLAAPIFSQPTQKAPRQFGRHGSIFLMNISLQIFFPPNCLDDEANSNEVISAAGVIKKAFSFLPLNVSNAKQST